MNVSSAVAILLFILDVRLRQGEACSPGPSSKVSSHHPRVSTPLNLKQRVPDVSEQTLGASGAAEEPISRGTTKFNDLIVENSNPDIQFKDEEGTGADRLMTQRCKDKLNTLAISVMNEWSGVQLRVIEAWDEDGLHDENSLHYEGRAVQITTSDRDKSKYGRLARLAVEAGFDWVSYYSRNFVHCSVQSDKSADTKGGCFHKMSQITLSSGEEKTALDLLQGDMVMVVHTDGTIGYSKVIMILDRRPDQRTLFRTLYTEHSKITLTPEHLIYISSSNSTFSESKAVFGSDVKEGDFVYVHQNGDDVVRPRRVIHVASGTSVGVVAPLTEEGTIVVDGIAASSYAVIRDEWIAHLSFAPLRWTNHLFPPQERTDDPQLHWYPRYLYKLGEYLVNGRLYQGFVLPD